MMILWEPDFNYASANDCFQHWPQVEKAHDLQTALHTQIFKTKMGPGV